MTNGFAEQLHPPKLALQDSICESVPAMRLRNLPEPNHDPTALPRDVRTLDATVKLLHHHEHLKAIKSGAFLPPVMVDIDPVDGVCNLDCEWCCQARSRNSRPSKFMSAETMSRLGPFCSDWGVKSWRISGDSEPLLHKEIDVLIESGFDSGIEMGLITNGVFLERLTSAARLTYLGISLDAVTPTTWSRLKQAPESDFEKIVENIKVLRDACPELDLCIKFVRYDSTTSLSKNDFSRSLPVLDNATTVPVENVVEADQFEDFARALGCRPIVKDAYSQESSDGYRFDVCRATPLGGVFDASHQFHLCCDARSVFVLTDDYTRDDWNELPRLWGSDLHRQMIDNINPQSCAGCAKQKINEVLEHVVCGSDQSAGYQLNFI